MTHPTNRPVKAAVLGASGYAGGELIRLLDAHPTFAVEYLGAHSQAGATLGAVHPQLRGGDRILGTLEPADVPDVDVVFFALPHGASAAPAMALANRGAKLVDLGSDFRLDSAQRYREAYTAEHPYPDELGRWVYGLPEWFGSAIADADRVAVPGCYPTSAILALAPMLASGLIEPHGIVVDSVSGTSGAGRGTKPNLTFGAVDEGVVAYGVTTHRHRPEMEQALARIAGTEPTIVFTPHLVPMQRGILSTCYAVAVEVDADAVTEAFVKAYAAAPWFET